MRCSICETDVSERALFCEVCGNRVRRAAEPRAAARAGVATASARTARTSAPAVPIVPREEIVAALHTRAELGERMEPEVLDAFIARMEQAVVTRVDEQIDYRMRSLNRVRRVGHAPSPSLPVAICSLIFGIPLSAIAGEHGLAGIAVTWVGIAIVNIAVNVGRGRE